MMKDWVRGRKLGHGSFATVNLAVPRSRTDRLPPLMAVKSCGVSCSSTLINEKLVLDELKDCPQVIRCFGESISCERGEDLYNVLLEYAPGGDLADRVKNSEDRRLPESECRLYTKALLKGLCFIHDYGYVHCDIKLQNILLTSNGAVKIADFGFAKRAGGGGEGFRGCEFRGTPLYMSPETVTGVEQEAPADVWALGCAVMEMVSGTPAWQCSDLAALVMRIGVGEEVPEIPERLSEDGKDFLRKCFVKNPRRRWTAEMLLNHPFLTDDQECDGAATAPSKYSKETSSSPRCPFDFPDWESNARCSITSLASPEYATFSDQDSNSSGSPPCITPPEGRLQRLTSHRSRCWPVSDDWIDIRC